MAAKKSGRRYVRGTIRRLFQENEWLYLLVGLVLGLLFFPLLERFQEAEVFREFLYDLVPEAVGIVFTVVIIDRLDSIREHRLVLDQLKRQMHSYYNPTALQAVEELRILGRLSDGSVRGLDLRGADLREANLYQADLRDCDLRNAKLEGADLYEANLHNAQVNASQLAHTLALRHAIMPDGTRYDGRYNLAHDFEVMDRKGFDRTDPASIAEYYGVPLEVYEKGQEWARLNLAEVRSSNRLIQPN
jgi:hypothetical protein